MKKQSTTSYIKSLDGIRALAMLGVMFFHLLPTKVEGGYLGVVTFFVLAGFLSTRTVMFSESEKNITHSLRAFVQKVRKLLPELVAMILVTILVMFLRLSEYLPDVHSQAISSIFCVNNIIQMINGESYFEAMATLKPFTHIWALSMEFQFYLLFALSIGAFYREKDKKKWLLLLYGVTILSVIVINLIYRQNADNTKVYYNTFARLSSFSIGTIGALTFAKKGQTTQKGTYLTSFAILTLLGISIYSFLAGEISEFIYRYGFLLYSLLSLATIYFVSVKTSWISEVLGSDIFGAIAKRSYSIYIWHFPVFKLYEKLMWRSQVPALLSLLMEFVLSLLVAELAYTIFSKLKKTKKTRQIRHRIALVATAILLIFPYKPHGEGIEKHKMLSELRMGIGGADIEIGSSNPGGQKEIDNSTTQANAKTTSNEKTESSESTTTTNSTTDMPSNTEPSIEEEAPLVTTNGNTTLAFDSQTSVEPSNETTLGTTNETNDFKKSETTPSEDSSRGEPGIVSSSSTSDSTDASNNESTEEKKETTTEKAETNTETKEQITTTTTYSEELLAFKEIYDQYSAMFPSIHISFDEYLTIRDRKITLVGDSISAMIATRLVEFFPNIEISAKKNRQSYEANDCYLAMKNEGRIGDVVILALGVNGCIDQENFDLVRDDIGVAKPMIITSVIHYNPTIEQDLNAMVYDYANTRENIHVIRWHENCKSHPELLYDDGVHPTDEGAIAYSYIIMEAVYKALQGQTISEY